MPETARLETGGPHLLSRPSRLATTCLRSSRSKPKRGISEAWMVSCGFAVPLARVISSLERAVALVEGIDQKIAQGKPKGIVMTCCGLVWLLSCEPLDGRQILDLLQALLIPLLLLTSGTAHAKLRIVRARARGDLLIMSQSRPRKVFSIPIPDIADIPHSGHLSQICHYLCINLSLLKKIFLHASAHVSATHCLVGLCSPQKHPLADHKTRNQRPRIAPRHSMLEGERHKALGSNPKVQNLAKHIWQKKRAPFPSGPSDGEFFVRMRSRFGRMDATPC